MGLPIHPYITGGQMAIRELNPNGLALIAVHIDGPWGDVLVPKSIQTTTWNVFRLRQRASG